ncbi:MAG: hypothetical protein P1U44_13250 [Vicingaceae bacterium]|nr:hypothetical protein [Vicingaceae bacterium]
MEERKESNKKELLSFGNYSNDTFMDRYLLEYIVKIKNIGVKYNDPYFPELFLRDCVKKMKIYMKNRGPLDW